MTPEEKTHVRNETIDELCDWLEGCIAQVDHNTDVFKACNAMVTHMRTKKTEEDVQHYPLNDHFKR